MVLKGKINDICDKLSKLSSECKKVGITKVCELDNTIHDKKCIDYQIIDNDLIVIKSVSKGCWYGKE